ncbi:MAG: PAS domain S-box protein [Syntrophales bacterium]|jgi:PAS domain S-box-containing protein
MKKAGPKAKHLDNLRKRAENKIPISGISTEKMSPPEIQEVVHELHVHQIELEMQNEVLQKSQAETAESQYKYSDLYDFAPVGYFTFDKKGHIIEANVTGASLLGAEKRSLAKQPFQRFVVPGHLSIFQSHLQKAHELRSKQICKLKLISKDGNQFDALIDTIAVIDGKGKFNHYRSSVTNITELTRAELLRESEMKYRGLYESTQDGIAMADMKGRIIECNRAFLDMLGYTEKEIRDIPYREMTPARWHEMERNIVTIKILKTGYSDVYEKEYIRKDGTVIPVSMRVWAIKDEAGNNAGMWGIVRDITEGKRTEEALKKLQADQQIILDSVPAWIFYKDKENRFIRVNRALEEIMEMSKEQLEGKSLFDIYPRDQAEAFWKDDKEVMASGRPKRNIIESMDTNRGNLRVETDKIPYRDAEGNIIGIIGFALDVTERELAEEALRRSEERYRSIFQRSHATTLLIDPNTGEIVDANTAACMYYGHTLAELKEMKITDINSLTREQVFEEMELAKTERRNHFVFSHRLANGEVRPVEVFSGPIELDGRHLLYSIVHDITERRRAEMALAERTAQLEAANKDLESFSYSVSHDLRAPLRAIDGFARMILKKQGDKFDKDTLDKFNIIRSNANMMGQLIDDLLAFSRLGKKHVSLTALDMNALIRDVWKDMENTNPGRKMVLTVDDVPSGYGDRALIKQVYINLFSNAVKFTKNRDAVDIETGGYSDGDEVVYYVRDNGVGFDMEYHDKLFGVFQRLHSADDFEGTGVGLAIVQRIVHRHGGRVWAEGKPDEGACFYFTLKGKE